MGLSNDKILEYNKRILLSRFRILMNNGFYGLLLMHMNLTLDESCETAYTDGQRIAFSPKFLDEISDEELDFIMMHEILHVALRHCERDGDRDPEIFNIACDIVVNSNILKSNNMDLKTITVEKYGVSMHLAPDQKEGYNYTAEEVYQMLPDVNRNNRLGNGNKNSNNSNAGNTTQTVDDHSRWQDKKDDDNTERQVWQNRIVQAASAMERQDGISAAGNIPMCAERILRELRKSQLDWRIILSEFIQEEVCDYTFSPPDRRFSDSPFFLPDFNGTETSVSNILFMIDTSGSMSDDAITAAYSEIKGAIDQFDGKLEGYLGFFDAKVVPPIPFSNVSEIKRIVPLGGGGTNFDVIFEYVNEHMRDNPPSSIIILTDGYAPFPDQVVANNIPVLWLLNNDDITPPWGKIARIKL